MLSAVAARSRLYGYNFPGPIPTSFSTTFSATENPISESGTWLNGAANATLWNNVRTTAGIACATAFNNPAGPYDDSIAILNPSVIAIGPDQLITATVFRAGAYAPTANHEINLFLRGAFSSGSIRGYEINLSLTGAYGYIVIWFGGGNSNLSFFSQLTPISHPNLVDGDVITAQMVGTVITVKLNGSTTLGTYDTVSDSVKWASGSCGQDYWAEAGATLVNAGLTSFSATTL